MDCQRGSESLRQVDVSPDPYSVLNQQQWPKSDKLKKLCSILAFFHAFYKVEKQVADAAGNSSKALSETAECGRKKDLLTL